MLEFTNKDIRIFVIGVTIFTVLYLCLFSKKGMNINIRGYISAFISCIMYGVCSIFIIVGLGIVRQAIKQHSENIGYVILCLGWLILSSIIVMKLIEKDFNIKFEFLSRIRAFIFKDIFKYIFLIVPLLFTGLTFYAAYVSRDNILQCVVLILVGIIFFIFGIFFFKLLNIVFNKKAKEKIINNSNKRKVKMSISKIMGIIFILFGIVFGLTYYMNINIKNKKENTAIIVNTIYSHNDSENGDMYYLVIEYSVNGQMYEKQIYSTSGKYNVGDNVKIIYNVENPNEVNIKPSIIIFIFSIIFVTGGLFLIVKNKISSKN